MTTTPPTTPPAIGPALEEWCDVLEDGATAPEEEPEVEVLEVDDAELEADGVASGVSPAVRLSGQKSTKM